MVKKMFFAEFYAPWCGHCKHLAPEYVIVGEAMEKAKPNNLLVTKVNCVDHASVCTKYGVSGYPTIKFLPKGSTTFEDYNAGRTAEDIIEFLNQKTKAGLKISKPYSPVVDLNPSNFDSIVLDSQKDVLVEFYAPWCGHCKQLAPKYELLAKAYINEDDVAITKVDCDKNKDLCSKYDVKGFPTLKWFSKKE